MIKTYVVKNTPFNGRSLVTGTATAETPKKALEKYLLHYYLDNQTIQYCKTFPRWAGADFIVTDTSTGRNSYYIVM